MDLKAPRRCDACSAELASTSSYHEHRRRMHPELIKKRIPKPNGKLAVVKHKHNHQPPMEMLNEQERQLDNHVSYAFGYAEARLDIYAQSIGVPSSVLTERVGDLLRRTPSGKVLGPRHSMQSLRSKAA